MTTGEKLALLRKRSNLTQDQLAETLGVSRQSVSRWEMDAAFPETEKLIKISRLFRCSIDYLLNETFHESEQKYTDMNVDDCYRFIRECGFFFLATSVDGQPRLRPFGMIYSNGTGLYISTDKRKSVYADLEQNPQVEMASFNLTTRKWIRISGKVEIENSSIIKNEISTCYPILKQSYQNENEMFFVIYRLLIDMINIS